MAYVKLDCGILESTLWNAKAERDMFITALLMARPFELKEPEPQIQVRSLEHTGFEVPPGKYGFIEAAGVGIARRALVDPEIGLAALEVLSAPDPESRTPDHDGRRIARVDGGYILLNYQKFRDKDHTAAARMRRYRMKKQPTALRRTDDDVTRNVTQAEADVLSIKNKKAILRLPPPPKTKEEVILMYSSLEGFKGLNVSEEYIKFEKWYSGPGKPEPTQRRFLKWLKNAAEDVVIPSGKKTYDPIRHSARNSYKSKHKEFPTREQLEIFMASPEWTQQN